VEGEIHPLEQEPRTAAERKPLKPERRGPAGRCNGPKTGAMHPARSDSVDRRALRSSLAPS
jgi:hypothetical protein